MTTTNTSNVFSVDLHDFGNPLKKLIKAYAKVQVRILKIQYYWFKSGDEFYLKKLDPEEIYFYQPQAGGSVYQSTRRAFRAILNFEKVHTLSIHGLAKYSTPFIRPFELRSLVYKYPISKSLRKLSIQFTSYSSQQYVERCMLALAAGISYLTALQHLALKTRHTPQILYCFKPENLQVLDFHWESFAAIGKPMFTYCDEWSKKPLKELYLRGPAEKVTLRHMLSTASKLLLEIFEMDVKTDDKSVLFKNSFAALAMAPAEVSGRIAIL